LFWGGGAETAARAGGDEEGGDTHEVGLVERGWGRQAGWGQGE
jgi:hypothetical protein